MALKVYEELEQGTDEWLQARCGLVTASELHKILTSTGQWSNSETCNSLLRKLAAERITNAVEYTGANRNMQRGTLLEPFARALYNEQIAPVTEVGFMTRDDWGFRAGYSPDGLVGEDGLIEIKSPLAQTHLDTVFKDKVPTQYKAQVQMGLRITGREWLDFVSFYPGTGLYVKRVYPDLDYHRQIDWALMNAEKIIQSHVASYKKLAQNMIPTEWFDPFEEQEIQVF